MTTDKKIKIELTDKDIYVNQRELEDLYLAKSEEIEAIQEQINDSYGMLDVQLSVDIINIKENMRRMRKAYKDAQW